MRPLGIELDQLVHHPGRQTLANVGGLADCSRHLYTHAHIFVGLIPRQAVEDRGLGTLGRRVGDFFQKGADRAFESLARRASLGGLLKTKGLEDVIGRPQDHLSNARHRHEVCVTIGLILLEGTALVELRALGGAETSLIAELPADEQSGFQQYKSNCDTHLVAMSGIAQVVLGTANNVFKSFHFQEAAEAGAPGKTFEGSVSSLLKEVTYTTSKGSQSPVFYCLAGNESNEYVGMCVEVPAAIRKATNIGKCLAAWVMYKLVELNAKGSHIKRFLAATFSTYQVRIALELTIIDHDTGEITVIDSNTVDGDEAMEIQQLQAEEWVDMSILTDGPPVMHGNAAAGFVFNPNEAPSIGSGLSGAPSMGDCSFARLQRSSESRGLAGALGRRNAAAMDVDAEPTGLNEPPSENATNTSKVHVPVNHIGTHSEQTPAPASGGAASNVPAQANVGESTERAPTVTTTAMGPGAK